MSSQRANCSLRGMALLFETARSMYTQGGFRAYYRGLGAGLIGVFPYSAIDMSTFEGIKLFYLKYTHKEDTGVVPLLAFGSISGSIGATTVYPLNLIRTRLQASGTPAHPRVYTSFLDAAVQTYRNEGFLGFYRGLIPSLAKVVPAVSISYVVYEQVRGRTHLLTSVQALSGGAIDLCSLGKPLPKYALPRVCSLHQFGPANVRTPLSNDSALCLWLTNVSCMSGRLCSQQYIAVLTLRANQKF